MNDMMPAYALAALLMVGAFILTVGRECPHEDSYNCTHDDGTGTPFVDVLGYRFYDQNAEVET
ncbi:hypothetical protein [Thalassobius sp. Cn5-15]|uniref:hypothetical protein n=1 Tax=Thalassobius sp. Cn5-15 TaxID=2917763 RepID=UPI001EF3826C|nr:hypothetical protein [Thalassobius sp. Cn5-15]MCG7492421.1 hypothetical protein [Thalassobius sp. Cn5-15]